MDAIEQDLRNQAIFTAQSQTISSNPSAVSRPLKASFDYRNKEGAKLLIKARLMDLPNIKDAVNKTINVIGYVDHYASREGDGGLIEEWRRIVIVCDDGTCYACGSIGVLQAMEIIESIKCERGLWKPPVPCVVKMKNMQGAKTWIWLEPDIDKLFDEPEPEPKKKK